MKKIIALRNALRVIGVSSALVIAVSLGAGIAKASISVGGENNTTGPCSENENEWNIDDHMDFDVTNHATLDNDQDFVVESGENEIAQNTVVDGFYGGDIYGDIEVENVLNNQEIDLFDMDLGDINIDFSNELTGPNSENENEAYIDVSTDIDIDNFTDIDNDLDLYANTGENFIGCNTQAGDIRTSDIDFNVSYENIANQSMNNLDLSGLGMVDINGDFSNSVTGPNSENENTLDINADTDVDINNHTDIDNDLDIYANTGENNIEHNTCVGDISTGDVRIDVSVLNQAN